MTDWHESPCEHDVDARPELFSLTIECSNDSFKPYWHIEVARILTDLSSALLEGDSIPTKLRDRNGNTVGSVSID